MIIDACDNKEEIEEIELEDNGEGAQGELSTTVQPESSLNSYLGSPLLVL